MTNPRTISVVSEAEQVAEPARPCQQSNAVLTWSDQNSNKRHRSRVHLTQRRYSRSGVRIRCFRIALEIGLWDAAGTEDGRQTPTAAQSRRATRSHRRDGRVVAHRVRGGGPTQEAAYLPIAVEAATRSMSPDPVSAFTPLSRGFVTGHAKLVAPSIREKWRMDCCTSVPTQLDCILTQRNWTRDRRCAITTTFRGATMWHRVALGLTMVGVAFAVSATRAKAEFVEFEFPCVVDMAIDRNSPQEILDLVGYPVIGTMTWAEQGTAGTVGFSYDTNAGAPNPNQPNLGIYFDVASLQLQFPLLTLSTNNTEVIVQNDLTYWSNDPTLYDSIVIQAWIPGAQVVLPPGTTTPLNLSFNIRLLSTDLTTFSDGYLPAEINLADFDTRQFSVMGDNFEAGNPNSRNYEWLSGGTVVPEPSTLYLLLSGLACVGLVVFRQTQTRRLLHRLLQTCGG